MRRRHSAWWGAFAAMTWAYLLQGRWGFVAFYGVLFLWEWAEEPRGREVLPDPLAVACNRMQPGEVADMTITHVDGSEADYEILRRR